MKTKVKKLALPTTVLLLIILIVGFFLRVYNIGNTLGFYYDQGRDALAIWNLLHKADFFLIGPTTGIAGIFRAPYYYYLIAPFYFLGGGNPIWPTVFLSFTTVCASFLAFFLGRKIHSDAAGIIAAAVSSFSYGVIMSSRWLSNPTPMLLLSMLLVLCMLLIIEKKKYAWYGISLILGLSLFSFGSASEVFYFVAVAIFAVWQHKNLPNKKQFIIASVLFFLTIAPLIVFDLKNDFIITGNIKKFFIEDKSFRFVTWDLVTEKINQYKSAFGKLLFNNGGQKEYFVLSGIIILIIYYFNKLIKLNGVKVLLMLLGSMMIGLVFFQGNEGHFYDYYLTGYYMIFLLLFSIGVGEIWTKNIVGKALILFFIYLFFVNSFNSFAYKLFKGSEGADQIVLSTELKAVEWIKKEGAGEEYNIDVYVPPVIPYSYDYLFLWRGVSQSEKQVPILYTLYEEDPHAMYRLNAWMERQDKIGKVLYQTSFGGITVQKRLRLP